MFFFVNHQCWEPVLQSQHMLPQTPRGSRCPPCFGTVTDEETSALDLLHRHCARILRKRNHGEIRCDALQHHSRWCQDQSRWSKKTQQKPQKILCFAALCLLFFNVMWAWQSPGKPGAIFSPGSTVETSNAFCWKYSNSESTSLAASEINIDQFLSESKQSQLIKTDNVRHFR